MKNNQLSIAEYIVVTGVRLKTIANRFLFAPMGTTNAKFRILRMLSDGKPKRPSDIIKFAGGTKSNVSQRLNSLEDDGLILRLPPQKGSDRRNVLIQITPKGDKAIKKLITCLIKATKELEKHFAGKEIADVFAFLDKTNRILDEKEKTIPKLFTCKNKKN